MPRMIASHERQRRIALVQQGLSDAEIGRQLGVDHSTISQWRHRESLPPCRTLYSPLDKAETARRKWLIDAGLSNAEIAKMVGRDRKAIAQTREKLGYPPMWEEDGRLSPSRRAERFRLMKAGWTDIQIAMHQRRSVLTVRQFRERHGLPLATGTLDEKARVIGLHAVEYGLADDTWSNWLEEMGATVW